MPTWKNSTGSAIEADVVDQGLVTIANGVNFQSYTNYTGVSGISLVSATPLYNIASENYGEIFQAEGNDVTKEDIDPDVNYIRVVNGSTQLVKIYLNSKSSNPILIPPSTSSIHSIKQNIVYQLIFELAAALPEGSGVYYQCFY